MAAENKSLGRFVLDGILPAPRGIPQVAVTFDIDANGILSVSAKDKATSREQKITIHASSGLSKDEIARMVREAELHADEDRHRREEIELTNQADALAYSAERTLREHGEKIPPDLKSEVEGKIAALRSALQANQLAQVRSALADLQTSLQKIGQAVYAQATPGAGPTGEPGPSGPGPTSPPGDGPIEGEFREV